MPFYPLFTAAVITGTKTAGKRSRGFTLLEILVALAVMSIAILGFMRGNSSLIANADYLRQKTLAHWVAMNQAAEIGLTGQWLNDKGADGVELFAGRSWKWQASGKVSPDPQVQIVTIEVRPEDEKLQSPLASVTMFVTKSGGTL